MFRQHGLPRDDGDGESATAVFGAQAAPSLSGFSPTVGTTGTSVTIAGSSFTGATAVTFGGTAAQSFSVDSDTQVTAVVAGRRPATSL